MMDDSQGLDIPIIRLRPLRERKIPKRAYDKILTSIKKIGLLEPLVVYPEGDDYVILDGVARYRVLLELGVEIVPCLVGKRRETFTSDRMVNQVSPVQESRMIEKSLTELDEQTIADTLGLAKIGHRMKKLLLQQLHPDVALAYDQGKIGRMCAQELTCVKPQRQRDILAAMDGYKDYSVAFARTLILKTPPALRDTRKRKHDPWDKTAQKKADLLKQLTEAEDKHDFYSRLYKQYTIDLLRLAIYARTLLSNLRIRAYLDEHQSAIMARFEAVIAETKG